MAKLFSLPDMWQPFGPFSMVALPGTGQPIYIKGQVALDGANNVIGPNDMGAQVRQALTNIDQVLASYGGLMKDVFALTHYTTDLYGFMAASEVREEFFAPPFPVSTTVEVRALFSPSLLVEISAIAEIPARRFRTSASAAGASRSLDDAMQDAE